jgi:hypothetical protein
MAAEYIVLHDLGLAHVRSDLSLIGHIDQDV